jgi:4a-hydroxytetrahydrobiopterin dehydratase
MSLAEKTCEPCGGGTAPMSREQAEQLLAEAPGWDLSEDGTEISRKYTFSNFIEAMDFVRWVGHAADNAGHHPTISLGWGFATVSYQTRKIKGLHENDFIMAARTNKLYEDSEDD